jgi:hypothetical protein
VVCNSAIGLLLSASVKSDHLENEEKERFEMLTFVEGLTYLCAPRSWMKVTRSPYI